MKYSLLIFLIAISFASYAQHRKAPQRLPPPPKPIPIAKELLASDILNGKSFSWKVNSDTILTPKDIYEKTYFFQTYNARLSKASFTETVALEKDTSTRDDMIVKLRPSLSVIYEDFDLKIETNIAILTSEKTKKITKLKLYKNQKGKVIKMKDLKTGEQFLITERYIGEPTISIGG